MKSSKVRQVEAFVEDEGRFNGAVGEEDATGQLRLYFNISAYWNLCLAK
jgi:hypothetical protein